VGFSFEQSMKAKKCSKKRFARQIANKKPLTNVAGAIALQLFIDKGYMKIDEVPDPYG
jgi:hypothetical protein